MQNTDVHIGLPCVYPQLCQWIGVALVVAFVVGMAAIIYAVIKDRRAQRQARQDRVNNRQVTQSSHHKGP
ncbi:MAG: FlaG/FlaF family flagellin (archaellin) [Paraglaciecola sp.]|jgi:FlaG/FlaF family flagellin (archaellin)